MRHPPLSREAVLQAAYEAANPPPELLRFEELLKANLRAIRGLPIWRTPLAAEERRAMLLRAIPLAMRGLRLERRLLGQSPRGLEGLLPPGVPAPSFSDHPALLVDASTDEVVAGVIEFYGILGPGERLELDRYCAQHGLIWAVDSTTGTHAPWMAVPVVLTRRGYELRVMPGLDTEDTLRAGKRAVERMLER